MHKYIVLHKPWEDEDARAFIVEIEDISKLKEEFFKVYIGVGNIDDDLPSNWNPNYGSGKFWLTEDDEFRFFHVDEEIQFHGIAAEGQSLTDAFNDKYKEQNEASMKDRRRKQYLELKNEFEGEENES